MAIYLNQTASSPVESVEFTPVSDGNFSFFKIRNAEQKDLVRKWLGEHMGQEIMAETEVGGKSVFVTRGDKTQQELIDALKLEGDELKLTHKESKGYAEGAWAVRSGLGMAGQFLQLSSSLMRGKRDLPLFIFALSNIAANTINLVYTSQKSEDINRLHFLKGHVNDMLAPHVAEGAALPSINDDRSSLREPPAEPLTVGQKANDFMEKNSVRVGELGLRYLGAFSMAADKKNPRRKFTGWSSIAGKTIAMGSKAEDPFNPKPHTWLDTLREKYTFRLGGIIETVAFAVLSYDGFKHGKINYPDKKFIPPSLRGQKNKRDYLSGMGAALFTLAYITRYWAKFGEKTMDMEELDAHITDSLAKMPPEKLPQLMAETAAFLTDHFKDKKLDFGKVYTQLMVDTYRYHQVSLNAKAQQAAAKNPPETESEAIAQAAKKIDDASEQSLVANTASREKASPIKQVIAARESTTNYADRIDRQVSMAEAQR